MGKKSTFKFLGGKQLLKIKKGGKKHFLVLLLTVSSAILQTSKYERKILSFCGTVLLLARTFYSSFGCNDHCFHLSKYTLNAKIGRYTG